MLSNNLEIFRARAEMWAESERPDTFPITAEDMLKFVAVAEAALTTVERHSSHNQVHDGCGGLAMTLDALAATLGGGDK